MSRFGDLVFKAFALIRDEHGFLPSPANSSEKFAALVSRQSPEVCYYAFSRIEGTQVVACNFWVAPVDFPDDSLDRLMVGYNIKMGSTTQDFGQFLSLTAQRLHVLIPKLKGVAERTQEELRNPIITTLRLQSYLKTRAAYSSIAKYSATSQGAYLAPVFQKAEETAKGVRSLSELEVEAVQMSKQLLIDPSAPQEVFDPHFRRDPAFLGSCLLNLMYIEALVPWPVVQEPSSGS